jgi:hypothetical protein
MAYDNQAGYKLQTERIGGDNSALDFTPHAHDSVFLVGNLPRYCGPMQNKIPK